MSDVLIANKTKQEIPLQVKPPNGDFFSQEQQIRLRPVGKRGSTVVIPEQYLNSAQVENCKARGFISVTRSA